jgi:hypothetical protein
MRAAIRADAQTLLHMMGRYRGFVDKTAIARKHGVLRCVVSGVLRRQRDRAPSPFGRTGRRKSPKNRPGPLCAPSRRTRSPSMQQLAGTRQPRRGISAAPNPPCAASGVPWRKFCFWDVRTTSKQPIAALGKSSSAVVGKCRLSYRFLTLRSQPHPPAPSMALHPLLATICFLTLWKRQSSYLTI